MRTAIAMFTALPVPRSWHEQRVTGPTLAVLPLLGGVLGFAAGVVASLFADVHLLEATLAVAVLALLTRGLHLDGLADTADGLGSRADPAAALAIMKKSDIGPFGVLAILFVVLVDVTALSDMQETHWQLPMALAVAAATGRLAVLYAALPGTAAARPGGFGALVAGRARPVTVATLTALVLGAGALAAGANESDWWRWAGAQVVALAVAALLITHTRRRLGGMTGDVFGALIEVTTAVTLIGLAT